MSKLTKVASADERFVPAAELRRLVIEFKDRAKAAGSHDEGAAYHFAAKMLRSLVDVHEVAVPR